MENERFTVLFLIYLFLLLKLSYIKEPSNDLSRGVNLRPTSTNDIRPTLNSDSSHHEWRDNNNNATFMITDRRINS